MAVYFQGFFRFPVCTTSCQFSISSCWALSSFSRPLNKNLDSKLHSLKAYEKVVFKVPNRIIFAKMFVFRLRSASVCCSQAAVKMTVEEKYTADVFAYRASCYNLQMSYENRWLFCKFVVIICIIESFCITRQRKVWLWQWRILELRWYHRPSPRGSCTQQFKKKYFRNATCRQSQINKNNVFLELPRSKFLHKNVGFSNCIRYNIHMPALRRHGL